MLLQTEIGRESNYCLRTGIDTAEAALYRLALIRRFSVPVIAVFNYDCIPILCFCNRNSFRSVAITRLLCA